MDWTATQLDQCARRTRRRRARLTVIAALVGTTALAAGILVARAAEPTRDTCQTDEDCAAACMKTAKTNKEKIECWAIVSTRPAEECKAAGDCIDTPKPVRFRPSQSVWQCNDLRITVTQSAPYTWNYDIGGTIWGGINLTSDGPNLYLRGVPCVPLR